MPLREKILYHQIHPFKITTDVLATFAGLYLYWQHQFWLGLIVTYVPSLIASGLVLYFANLQKISKSRMGSYVQANMTRSLEVTRFLTTFIMLSGAWYHQWWLVLTGIVIVIGCWCWGLILDTV